MSTRFSYILGDNAMKLIIIGMQGVWLPRLEGQVPPSKLRYL